MRTKEGKQVCFKCKAAKPISDFYKNGNQFINCVGCRSDRAMKKRAIRLLLDIERKMEKI